jgi:hypothetical protein
MCLKAEIYEEGKQCPSVFQPHSNSQPSFHELQKCPPPGTHTPGEQRRTSVLDVPDTNFSMSYNVPSGSPQPTYNPFNVSAPQSHDILPSRTWPESHSTFDTEMSSDPTSNRQGSISNHPTPSTSHQGSSNTSYSPPHIDESDAIHATTHHPTANLPSSFFHPSAPFSGFSPPPDAAFGMQPTWDLGADHGLPGASTGMSPLGDVGWRQMLEGMSWDGNQLGTDGGWRPTPTSTHGAP